MVRPPPPPPVFSFFGFFLRLGGGLKESGSKELPLASARQQDSNAVSDSLASESSPLVGQTVLQLGATLTSSLRQIANRVEPGESVREICICQGRAAASSLGPQVTHVNLGHERCQLKGKLLVERKTASHNLM